MKLGKGQNAQFYAPQTNDTIRDDVIKSNHRVSFGYEIKKITVTDRHVVGQMSICDHHPPDPICWIICGRW